MGQAEILAIFREWQKKADWWKDEGLRKYNNRNGLSPKEKGKLESRYKAEKDLVDMVARGETLMSEWDSPEEVWEELQKVLPNSRFRINNDLNSNLYGKLSKIRTLCKHLPANIDGASLSNVVRTRVARRLELDAILESISDVEKGAPEGTAHRLFADAELLRSQGKEMEEEKRLKELAEKVVQMALDEEVKLAGLDKTSRKQRRIDRRAGVDIGTGGVTTSGDHEMDDSEEVQAAQQKAKVEAKCSKLLDDRTPLSFPTSQDFDDDPPSAETSRMIFERADCYTATREADQAIKGLLDSKGNVEDRRIAKHVPRGATLEAVRQAEQGIPFPSNDNDDDDDHDDDDDEEEAEDFIEIIFAGDTDHQLLHRHTTARMHLMRYWSPSLKKMVWRLVDIKVRDCLAQLWWFETVRSQLIASQIAGGETSQGTFGVSLGSYMKNKRIRVLDSESTEWYEACKSLQQPASTPQYVPGTNPKKTVSTVHQLNKAFAKRVERSFRRKKGDAPVVLHSLEQLCSRVDSLAEEEDLSPTITKLGVATRLALTALRDGMQAKRIRFGGVPKGSHQPSNHLFHARPSKRRIRPASPPPPPNNDHIAPPHCIDVGHPLPPSTFSSRTIENPGLEQRFANETSETLKALHETAKVIKESEDASEESGEGDSNGGTTEEESSDSDGDSETDYDDDDDSERAGEDRDDDGVGGILGSSRNLDSNTRSSLPLQSPVALTAASPDSPDLRQPLPLQQQGSESLNRPSSTSNSQSNLNPVAASFTPSPLAAPIPASDSSPHAHATSTSSTSPTEEEEIAAAGRARKGKFRAVDQDGEIIMSTPGNEPEEDDEMEQEIRSEDAMEEDEKDQDETNEVKGADQPLEPSTSSSQTAPVKINSSQSVSRFQPQKPSLPKSDKARKKLMLAMKKTYVQAETTKKEVDRKPKFSVTKSGKERQTTKGLGIKGRIYARRSLVKWNRSSLYRKVQKDGSRDEDASDEDSEEKDSPIYRRRNHHSGDLQHVIDTLAPIIEDDVANVRDIYETILRQLSIDHPSRLAELVANKGRTVINHLLAVVSGLTYLYSVDGNGTPATSSEIDRKIGEKGGNLSTKVREKYKTFLLEQRVTKEELKKFWHSKSPHRGVTDLVISLIHKRRSDLYPILLDDPMLCNLNFATCGSNFSLAAAERSNKIPTLLARTLCGRLLNLFNYGATLPFSLDFDNVAIVSAINPNTRRVLELLMKGTRSVHETGSKHSIQSGYILGLISQTLRETSMKEEQDVEPISKLREDLVSPFKQLVEQAQLDPEWKPSTREEITAVPADCIEVVLSFLPVFGKILRRGHIDGVRRRHKAGDQDGMNEMMDFETFEEWMTEDRSERVQEELRILVLQLYPLFSFAFIELEVTGARMDHVLLARVCRSPNLVHGGSHNLYLPDLVTIRQMQLQAELARFNSGFTHPLPLDYAHSKIPSSSRFNDQSLGSDKSPRKRPGDKARDLQRSLDQHDYSSRSRNRLDKEAEEATLPKLGYIRGVHDYDVNVVRPPNPNARFFEISADQEKHAQLVQACANHEEFDLSLFKDSRGNFDYKGGMTKFLKRLREVGADLTKLNWRIEGDLGSTMPTGDFEVRRNGTIVFDLVDPRKMTSGAVFAAQANGTNPPGGVSLGMNFKDGLSNYVSNKPDLKTAILNLKVDHLEERIHPSQQKIKVRLPRIKRHAANDNLSSTNVSSSFYLTRRPLPFFERVKIDNKWKIVPNPNYWSSKSNKPVKRDEESLPLYKRGPLGDEGSKSNRALEEGRKALNEFDRQLGIEFDDEWEDVTVSEDQEMEDEEDSTEVGKIHFCGIDTGTTQYVALGKIEKGKVLFSKQGSTDQRKRAQVDSRVARQDGKFSEGTRLAKVLTGKPLPTGGAAILLSRNTNLDHGIRRHRSHSAPPRLGRTLSSPPQRQQVFSLPLDSPVPPTAQLLAQRSRAKSNPPEPVAPPPPPPLPLRNSTIFRSDLSQLSANLQNGAIPRHDHVHMVRQVRNKRWRKRHESSGAQLLVNKMFPKPEKKGVKEKVVVFVGVNDRTKHGKVRNGTGTEGLNAFLNAIKAAPHLELIVLTIEERFTSMFCVDPNCSANCLNPERIDSPKPSPIFRMEYCIECQKAMHHDYLGAVNIVRKGMDVLRKNKQEGLEILKTTDVLSPDVRRLVGHVCHSKKQAARIGRMINRLTKSCKSQEELFAFLDDLKKDGVAIVNGMIKEANLEKKRGRSGLSGGDGDAAAAEGKLLGEEEGSDSEEEELSSDEEHEDEDEDEELEDSEEEEEGDGEEGDV